MDAETLGGAIAKRARRRRPRRQPAQAAPTIHVTVNFGGASQAPPKPRRRKGSVRPGRPGDVIDNDRSRLRRIGPSPG